MLNNELAARLERSNQLYLDLIAQVPEKMLASRLGPLRSNEIGQQLWCVIGARNSYLRATKAGEWCGFQCPLPWEKTRDAMAIGEALQVTSRDMVDYLRSSSELALPSLRFVLDLLEHEVLHHGQLARYVYGLNLEMPQTWKDRYHFD